MHVSYALFPRRFSVYPQIFDPIPTTPHNSMSGSKDVFHIFKAVEALLEQELEVSCGSGSQKGPLQRGLYSSPYVSRTGNSRSPNERKSSQLLNGPLSERSSRRSIGSAANSRTAGAEHNTTLQIMFTRWARACAEKMEQRLADERSTDDSPPQRRG
jgi:hypothetical protein